jgi:hypothetical protein
MKTIFIFIFVLFTLTGCSNKPPVAIPIAPPLTESVKPFLKKTQANIDDGIVDNIKIGEKVKNQNESLVDQKITIDEAIIKAEKIKSELVQSGLSVEEVNKLIYLLKQIGDKNKTLSGKNKELFEQVNKQNKNLMDSKKNAQETFEKLVDKENEASDLRTQRDFLASNLDVKNKENETLKKKLATAQVYRRWVLGVIISLMLVGVALFAFRIYKPFR